MSTGVAELTASIPVAVVAGEGGSAGTAGTAEGMAAGRRFEGSVGIGFSELATGRGAGDASATSLGAVGEDVESVLERGRSTATRATARTTAAVHEPARERRRGGVLNGVLPNSLVGA